MELEKERMENYMKKGGVVCPWCNSNDIEAKPPDYDHSIIIQEVECKDCRREWRDIYELTLMERTDTDYRIKKTYFLESISSTIIEDDYEKGEATHDTGCGLPHTPISKRFNTLEKMLDYIKHGYGYNRSCFDGGNDEYNALYGGKQVADHGAEQNGGWFEPTEDEIKLWKLGEKKLYSENITVRYHIIYEGSP